jgi:hypothetical protein
LFGVGSFVPVRVALLTACAGCPPFHHHHSGGSMTTTIGDRVIAQAMAVYDTLNEGERRTVFETTVRAALTGDMHSFAESLLGMVRLETQHPEARQAIRDVQNRPAPEPGAGIPLGNMIAVLRGEV